MDALKRPLRIPVEFSRYAEEKGVFELYEVMLKEILIHRPEDPLTFFCEFLSRKDQDVPKVIIYGPPVSGQCTVSHVNNLIGQLLSLFKGSPNSVCAICLVDAWASSKLAARKLKAVHVSAMVTLQEDQSQEGIEAKSLKEANEEIPDRTWAKIIGSRVTKPDCRKRGWVLEGFPKTRLQALALQTEGVLASHFASAERSFSQMKLIKDRLRSHLTELSLSNLMKVAIECPEKLTDSDLEEILKYGTEKAEGLLYNFYTLIHLTLPDAVLQERYSGKRVDPITGGSVLCQVFLWMVTNISPFVLDLVQVAAVKSSDKNKEVAQRLIEEPGGLEENVVKPLAMYHRHCESVLSCYKNMSKTFNSDQPMGDLFAQVYVYLCSVGRSCAPRVPRVVLIGPTGSGKSLQAAQLARAYKLVDVDCKRLIKQTLASGTKAGLAMKPFHDRGMLIPDDMVMAVLSKRLEQLDVLTRGYVLHGFPANRTQAELLAHGGHKPNRVYFLNIPEESIEERLTLRRVDPENGDNYHLLFRPPTSQEVKDRLKIHPKYTREKVQERIGRYNRSVEDLMIYYDWGHHVNAEEDPLTVFEHLESHLIEGLPKQPPPSLEEISASVNI